MKELIKKLEEAKNIQCQNGNWNYNEYMFGMANGLIFALAVMKEEEPVYLERPIEFLECRDLVSTPIGSEDKY